MAEEMSYGQVAYLAYRANYGWADVGGTYGAHWEELSDTAKAGWDAAANAAIAEHGEHNATMRSAMSHAQAQRSQPATPPRTTKADKEDK